MPSENKDGTTVVDRPRGAFAMQEAYFAAVFILLKMTTFDDDNSELTAAPRS